MLFEATSVNKKMRATEHCNFCVVVCSIKVYQFVKVWRARWRTRVPFSSPTHACLSWRSRFKTSAEMVAELDVQCLDSRRVALVTLLPKDRVPPSDT